MKTRLLIIITIILVSIGTINNVFAPCCFPYDSDGYIDPTTRFFVGISEVQNDSYLGLPFGNVTYHFQFFDENNNVILEKTETITDDLPIKSGFVIPPGLTIPFKVAINDVELSKKIRSFQFAGTENLEYYSWKPADLIVSFDKIELDKFDNNFNTWKIQGIILNNHTQSTKNVYVLASIHQKEYSHIIGIAGYSAIDIQPLALDGFESKNFTLYSTIPSNLTPDHVNLYAESDESSMVHQHYKPIILKDATNYEGKTTTDTKKPITLSANVTNISRNNLDFDWIIQIKKSHKSISEGDLTKDPESKIEFIKTIPTHVDAQKSIKLEYLWTPQSNGIYFYEMYLWDDSKPLSYPFTGDFLSTDWMFVSSNMNSVTNQIESGIPIDQIQCKEGFEIVFKKSNGNPICITPNTLEILSQRDWIAKGVILSEPELTPLEHALNEDGTISENTNPYTLYDIIKLNRINKVGEPISFTIMVQGWDDPCFFQHYEIISSKNLSTIWEYQQSPIPCPSPHYEKFKKTWTVPNNDVEAPIINETGAYLLRVYDNNNGFMVTEFTVVDNAFVRNTVDPCNVTFEYDEKAYEDRQPPPTPIDSYGRDATVLEPFSFDTSVGRLTIPSYMPSCYELKSDKIQEDLRTLVYYPKDTPFSSETTASNIIEQGIMILVSSDSQSPSDWKKTILQMVDEAPDIRDITTLKDHDVLLVYGIPTKNVSSQVHMVIDGFQIQIISTKLDTTYLMKILDSMFEN